MGHRAAKLREVLFDGCPLGWILFRAADLRLVEDVVDQILATGKGHGLIPAWQLWLIALSLVMTRANERYNLEKRIVEGPMLLYATVIAVLLFGVELLSQVDKTLPFVYFQF